MASAALAENTITTMSTPNAVIDLQHHFTPTILNDVKLGFNRDAYQDVGDGQTPYSVTITGFASYALGDHSARIDNSYSFIDDATIIGGPHLQIRHRHSRYAGKQNASACIAEFELSQREELHRQHTGSLFLPAPGIETQARKTPILSYGMDDSNYSRTYIECGVAVRIFRRRP